MPLRKTLIFASLVTVAMSLTIGFMLIGQWFIAILGLLPTTALLITIKYPKTWLALAALLTYVGLAAAGVLLDAKPILMLISSTFALAAWDMVMFDHSIQGNYSDQVQILENKHYRSLLLAIILSSVVIGIGQFMHFQASFLIILFPVLLAFYSLDKILRIINSKV